MSPERALELAQEIDSNITHIEMDQSWPKLRFGADIQYWAFTNHCAYNSEVSWEDLLEEIKREIGVAA